MKRAYTLHRDGEIVGVFTSQKAAIAASGFSIFTKPWSESKKWNIGDVWTALTTKAKVTITVGTFAPVDPKIARELKATAKRIDTDSDFRKQLLAAINNA